MLRIHKIIMVGKGTGNGNASLGTGRPKQWNRIKSVCLLTFRPLRLRKQFWMALSLFYNSKFLQFVKSTTNCIKEIIEKKHIDKSSGVKYIFENLEIIAYHITSLIA